MYYLIRVEEELGSVGPLPFTSSVVDALSEMDEEVSEQIFVVRLLDDASMTVVPAQEFLDTADEEDDDADEG